MPIRNYSVLKGRPIGIRLGTGSSPHYQIHIVADDADYRVAINIESGDGSEVEFVIVSRFAHPILDGLQALESGLHAIPSKPNGVALDFIRANLFDPQDMTPLPAVASGPDNDLNEKLDHYVQRALADEDAVIYAFGETWGPETKADQYFGFRPGRGIHDIHMNQGNPPKPAQWFHDNGPWQDGGLVFEFPRQNEWAAAFMKFQSQSWHTDDATGNPLDLGGGGPPSDGVPNNSIPPDHIPTDDKPDGLVRIIAALVNDVHSPERETVTLLNTSDRDIDLGGWKLADKTKNKMALAGKIAAGGTTVVAIKAPVALSNKGGIITLLDSRGVKVDGVSYTKEQAHRPGLTIVF
jgi:uncharacterized protein YukJ